MCKSKLHTPSVLKTETSHQLSGFFEHSEFLRNSLFVFFLLGFFPIAFPNSDFKEGENRPGARQTYHRKRDLSKKKKLKTTMPHVTLWRMQRMCRMWRMLMFFNAFLFLLLRFQEQWRILAVEHVIVYV